MTRKQLREHNRRKIWSHYQAHIRDTLNNLRHDLMIQGDTAAERADQVAGVHALLQQYRQDALARAERLADEGLRICGLRVEANQLIMSTERATLHEVSS